MYPVPNITLQKKEVWRVTSNVTELWKDCWNLANHTISTVQMTPIQKKHLERILVRDSLATFHHQHFRRNLNRRFVWGQLNLPRNILRTVLVMFFPVFWGKQITSKQTLTAFLLPAKTTQLLVVSILLKNGSQIGSFPQVGLKTTNIWNHT